MVKVKHLQITILFLLVSLTSFGASKTVVVHDTVYVEQRTLELLEKQLENVDKNNESMRQLIDNSSAMIGNTISGVELLLSVVGIILALFGGGIAWYIGKKKDEVYSMLDQVKEKKAEIVELKSKVDETNKLIQDNVSGLYSKLREEESLALLKRLEEVPLDIANLEELLLARKLPRGGFEILKRAYILGKREADFDKEEGFSISYRDKYLVQFFQHFPYEAIMDGELSSDLTNFMQEYGLEHAFRNDVIYFTKMLCKAFSEDTTPFNKQEVLKGYLKTINGSKFKDFEELKQIMRTEIHPQALLEDALASCREEGDTIQLFEEREEAQEEE